MAKMGSLKLQVASADDPENPQWVEIGGDVVGEWFTFRPTPEPTPEPPPMDLSRIEHDMEALVAEYPADLTAAASSDDMGWISFSIDTSMIKSALQNMMISWQEEAEQIGLFAEAMQEVKKHHGKKEIWFGPDDTDPDDKPNRAERRNGKSTQALGSGPTWRDDNRPGVRDFRRRERRNVRRGRSH